MDAQDILRTPLAGARVILGDEPALVRRRFKAMAAQWHPDVCSHPQAAMVFAHIVSLRDAALSGHTPKASQGLAREIHLSSGRRLATRPFSVQSTDTGETWVGGRTVSFVFKPDCADLALLARQSWSGLRWADGRMKDAFVSLAPATVPVLDGELRDGGHVLAIRRAPGYVALPDLLRALGGAMEPVHVAWLGSGLFNLVTWIQWMGLAHGGIAPESIFVDPTTHAVALLGGWEYATPLGQRPVALPGTTLAAIPGLEVAGATVDKTTDSLLVREVLRLALGDPARLCPRVPDLPEPVAQAIAQPPRSTGLEEYKAWIAVLEEGWGPRRFRVLDIDATRIYGST